LAGGKKRLLAREARRGFGERWLSKRPRAHFISRARTNLAGPNAMNGKKETVLDLGKFIDKGVRVKLSGGREVTGTLKGFDQLLNLVLDECVESLRDVNDPLKITDETRNLGLIVCRGTSVMVVSGLDGMEEIANPFLPSEEGGAVMAGGE
jgi:U6 snRNA-associated Sm-like protein LSm7